MKPSEIRYWSFELPNIDISAAERARLNDAHELIYDLGLRNKDMQRRWGNETFKVANILMS